MSLLFSIIHTQTHAVALIVFFSSSLFIDLCLIKKNELFNATVNSFVLFIIIIPVVIIDDLLLKKKNKETFVFILF
jgi:hypothetical protein